jgi:aspartate beta-hydroxylase
MTDPRIVQLMRLAVEAQRAGDSSSAMRLFTDLIEIDPNNPGALNSLGIIHTDKANYESAQGLFERAIAIDQNAPELWMNLAKAQRLAGDDAGEAASLNAALAIDQRHFMALVRLAQYHERRREKGQAMFRWSAVVQLASSMDIADASLASVVKQGQSYLALAAAELDENLSLRVAPLRHETDAASLRRFDACIDVIMGRRRVYINECHGLHYPFLPADEFFDRDHFPWLGAFEAATPLIRDELLQLLQEGTNLGEPYVQQAAGTPVNKWTSLNHSSQWSAWFFWKLGVKNIGAAQKCPITASILDTLPLAEIPGKGPTAFFSLLHPQTKIPPHTGVTNVRSIVHLPLIVPPNCGFRVGGETREWTEGEAFAFDDTIEHEAWNNSQSLRAVLIIDVWNPHLTADERRLLTASFQELMSSGLDPFADF